MASSKDGKSKTNGNNCRSTATGTVGSHIMCSWVSKTAACGPLVALMGIRWV